MSTTDWNEGGDRSRRFDGAFSTKDPPQGGGSLTRKGVKMTVE